MLDYDSDSELVDFEFDPYESYGDADEFGYQHQQSSAKHRLARRERRELREARKAVSRGVSAR